MKLHSTSLRVIQTLGAYCGPRQVFRSEETVETYSFSYTYLLKEIYSFNVYIFIETEWQGTIPGTKINVTSIVLKYVFPLVNIYCLYIS